MAIKINRSQAEILAALFNLHYKVGDSFRALDAFPVKDALDNGRRRGLTKLAQVGVLTLKGNIYAITPETAAAYRAWYLARGYQTNHQFAFIEDSPER